MENKITKSTNSQINLVERHFMIHTLKDIIVVFYSFSFYIKGKISFTKI